MSGWGNAKPKCVNKWHDLEQDSEEYVCWILCSGAWVYDTVAHFNVGAEAAVNIFKEVNLKPGEYFLQWMRKINKERVAKADFEARDDNKKQRKMLHGLKKKKDDKQKQEESICTNQEHFEIFWIKFTLLTPIYIS